MNRFVFLGSLALLLSISLTTKVQAQTIVLNNIPGTNPFTAGDTLGTSDNIAANQRWAAVSLNNNSAFAASLNNVQATFSNVDSVNRVVSGGIFSDIGGSPGIQLVAFNQQTINIGQTHVQKTFIPAVPFSFQSGVAYWVTFTGDITNTNGALVWRRDTANTAPVASNGFGTVGYKASTNNQAAWVAGIHNDLVQVTVTFAAPEPGTLALAGLAGIVVLGSRRRLFRRA